jgi:ClpP class serine protease
MNRTVLMMQPGAFREAADAYDAVRQGHTPPLRISPRVVNLPGRLAERVPVSRDGQPHESFVAGPVGVVQVNGPMWYSASPMAALMGYGSVSALIAGLDRHRTDPKVTRGVLDIQSPGGEASTLPELADAVRRFTAEKPLHARLSGNVFSLGYAAACLATEISIGPGGRVGSIGSIVSMLDDSKRLEADGLRFITAASSAKKLRHAPGQPLGEEVLADLQAQVDRYGADFYALVAEGRGIDPATVASWEGGEFFADQAAALGLVDVIETEHAFWERVERMTQTDAPVATPRAAATNHTGRVAPRTAGVAARTAKGARMSGTQNKGGVAKNMTAKALVDKMKNSGEYDDDFIAKATAMIEEEPAENAGGEEEEQAQNAGVKPGQAAAHAGKAASFTELDRVVPTNLADRDTLITKMQREGACVNRAMAMVNEALLAQMQAITAGAANTAAAGRETAVYPKGRPPVAGANRGNGAQEAATDEWERRVHETMQAGNLPRHEAVRKVNNQHPELRKRVIAEANAGKNQPPR